MLCDIIQNIRNCIGDVYMWLTRGFIDKKLYAPFFVEKDSDYYDDLRNRYLLFYNKAKSSGADEASLKVIKRYKEKVLECIRDYYHGNITSFHQKIENLVKGVIDNRLAVDTINDSYAFLGKMGSEIQFFRGRISPTSIPYKKEEMLYLKKSLRGLSDTYRFSIPGVPCFYLGNSSYACWLELGRPSDHDFVVSPVLLDGSQKVLNLAVMIRDLQHLDSFKPERVECWLKLMILMMATSYRVKDDNRKFRSEYIVSQSIMLACNKLGLDGVAYYSKQVDDEMFSMAAINVALFVKYKTINSNKSLIDEHIKIEDSFNFQLFRQLEWSETYKYPLRCLGNTLPNKIGNYKRQYNYEDTSFCKFDQFLYSGWKDKNTIPFGI